MRLLRLLAGLLLAFTMPAFAQETAAIRTDNPLQTPLDKKIDSLARAYITQPGVAGGLSIGITRNGKQFTYNYGEVKKGYGQLPDSSTVYEIGSLSKTFTATLFALEIINKKMKKDDLLSRYLPDNIPVHRYNDTPITLVTLVNHTSALPRLPQNLFETADASNPYAHYTTNMMYKFLGTYKLERAPGTKYEYSNIAPGLMSTILGQQHKMPYAQLLQEAICRPLGMNNTAVKLTPAMESRFAQGYDAGGKAVNAWDFQEIAGAGGIRSTVADLLRFLHANMDSTGGKLYKAMALCREPTFSKDGMTVGMGWHIGNIGRDKFYNHTGATGGFASYTAFVPARNTGFTILCNRAAQTNIGNDLLIWLYMN
ncbi:serine hydrolase [uncultured Chitinophaga sp.]|uniref:serine hydrolase domain-containing protein n=1 Tax=uncultured Chitinophaga sp. TaxID=339340 RepID=UPI0025F0F0F4|nr:serine hydrolase [uncultured Chitinophaga sp.]